MIYKNMRIFHNERILSETLLNSLTVIGDIKRIDGRALHAPNPNTRGDHISPFILQAVIGETSIPCYGS